MRIAMFVVMGAMLVCALAVPEAFGDHGVIFGVAYLVVRAMHIALYAIAARGDPDLLGAVLRMTPSSTISGFLILGAGFLEGKERTTLWILALAIDYLGVLVGRGRAGAFAGHFVERHGLVVIIAIGESVVALGVSASGTPLTAGVIDDRARRDDDRDRALVDVLRLGRDRRRAPVREATGTAQTTLARDAFSYLHFVIVAGIVLFAMSLKKALAHYDAGLAVVPATALCAGLGAYLLAHVLLRYRISERSATDGPVAFVALMVLWPLRRRHACARGAVGRRGRSSSVLIAYEGIRYREPRAYIRHGGVPTAELIGRVRQA